MNKIPSGFGLSVTKLDVPQPSLHDQSRVPSLDVMFMCPVVDRRTAVMSMFMIIGLLCRQSLAPGYRACFV